MPKKKPMTWMVRPARPKKPSIPESVKALVDAKAKKLVATALKPKFIQRPPRTPRFNYIIDVAVKWHGSSLYFISTYACPRTYAISPTFETKFARMEYVGDGKFALSFMRYTGQWVRLYDALTVNECMKAIKDDPWFQP